MKGTYYNQGIGRVDIVSVPSQSMSTQMPSSLSQGLGGGGTLAWHPTPTPWRFDGEFLTITEFAQRVYGDTPQRTEFLLKYAK